MIIVTPYRAKSWSSLGTSLSLAPYMVAVVTVEAFDHVLEYFALPLSQYAS